MSQKYMTIIQVMQQLCFEIVSRSDGNVWGKNTLHNQNGMFYQSGCLPQLKNPK